MKHPLLSLLVAAMAVLPMIPASAEVTVLKNCSSLDGSRFFGSVFVASDGLIYGASTYGGASDQGAFFQLSTSGSGFNTTYDFNTANGSYPIQSPIEGSDGKFYGGTYDGGANGDGAVYSINKDGSGYTILRSLTAATDGRYVYGRLLEGQDGKLYGVTNTGGTNNVGTIFRLRKDGSGFAVLRSFTTATDGSAPLAGLIQAADGRLYGVTSTGGGGTNGGTIFSINTDGTGFTVLKAFSVATDGVTPVGRLVLGKNNVLYGTTTAGGATSGGVVFKIKTDGTGFVKLHEFDTAAPGSDNGYYPYAGLTIGVDGWLYGTTFQGRRQQ